MSDQEKRWPAAEARAVAFALQAQLWNVTEELAIAGSLRRGRPTVGDIELLFIGKQTLRKVDMFEEKPHDLALEEIDRLLASGVLEKRPSKTGVFTWGEKNRLAIHKPSGIPVDFFATTPENWWVSLVIRTGSKETNLRLTNGAIARGGKLNAYGSGVTIRGETYPAQSEEDVFQLCGVPYLPPGQR